jgi:drug/metabolite transporter (DMT)-like permease
LRRQQLQRIGVLSGIAAGAWLGAAEAPTKLVATGLSPTLVSLCMVFGVFVARWSAPALVRGVRAVGDDVRQAPHLVVWAVLGGCLWAVANTLTVYAIRDVGLSIAFPLWNTNSVIGMLWGVLFFGELRGARRARVVTVVASILVLFVAALLIADASATHAPRRDVVRGIAAALAAGALWGTMYIPYRKAYVTGMNPLSFLTFFTVGEVVTMTMLALGESGGFGSLVHSLSAARGALFWLALGGFVWVVGDIAQQYAVKYVGISRGIPLSNTNQLWGLLWGGLVFGELDRASVFARLMVVCGSVLMVLAAGAIAGAAADEREQERWDEATAREVDRYGVDAAFARTRAVGEESNGQGRSWVDWGIVALATATFVGLAVVARWQPLAIHLGWLVAVAVASVAILVAWGIALWRTTRFA